MSKGRINVRLSIRQMLWYSPRQDTTEITQGSEERYDIMMVFQQSTQLGKMSGYSEKAKSAEQIKTFLLQCYCDVIL
jgi:hypothetical protein